MKLTSIKIWDSTKGKVDIRLVAGFFTDTSKGGWTNYKMIVGGHVFILKDEEEYNRLQQLKEESQ